MRKNLLIVLALILASCSTDKPIKVQGEIHFGHYSVSPPLGYWYFPRNFPESFESPEKLFLVSFFKSKDVFKKNAPNLKETSFNIGVLKNSYTSYEDYYAEGKKHEVLYEELSPNLNDLITLKGWSCKKPNIDGQFVVECISLRNNLVEISANGENEKQIFGDLNTFIKILKSFRSSQ